MDQNPDTEQHDGIGVLNGFLRGELAAVATYRQALELDAIDAASRNTLRTCLYSHERRAAMIENEIRRLGGDPVESSGLWGSFAKLVEGGAKMLGPDAAVRALEEGEGLGSVDYHRVLYKLPQPARSFVTTQIIPEQERTQAALSALVEA